MSNVPAVARPFRAATRLDSAALHKVNLARRTLRAQIQNARDYNSMGGGALGEIAGAPLACLPSSIPATRTREIPMSPDEFDLDFGPEFSLIPDNASQQSTGLISKLTTGGTPLAPFFLRAVCLLIRVDPNAFAQVGSSVARPTTSGTAPIRTPRVIPVGGVPDDPTARPAVFEYNHQLLQGVQDLLLAYQFQYLLQGRFLMINERAMDVGLVDSHTCMQGFGTANADPGLAIAQLNAYLAAANEAQIFQSPNVSAVGVDGQPLEPNLVQIQYATPVAPGVFGVCYPVKPHVLFPGQNYQFLLTRVNESIYFNRLRERWTKDGQLTKPDPLFADSRPADLDGPAIWGGYDAYRYGVLQYGTLLRGAELLPESCMQWLLAFGQPYQSVISQPEVWAQVDALARQCGLNGVPKPLGARGVDPRWEKTRAITALFQDKIDANGVLAGLDVSEQRIDKADLISCLHELDVPAQPITV